jgi:hypothetical protein
MPTQGLRPFGSFGSVGLLPTYRYSLVSPAARPSGSGLSQRPTAAWCWRKHDEIVIFASCRRHLGSLSFLPSSRQQGAEGYAPQPI